MCQCGWSNAWWDALVENWLPFQVAFSFIGLLKTAQIYLILSFLIIIACQPSLCMAGTGETNSRARSSCHTGRTTPYTGGKIRPTRDEVGCSNLEQEIRTKPLRWGGGGKCKFDKRGKCIFVQVRWADFADRWCKVCFLQTCCMYTLTALHHELARKYRAKKNPKYRTRIRRDCVPFFQD